ncbi:rod shape-determining protein MreD [Ochrovirga pacifica]|uniref:rod shape-determining protein MreD n=1 Tax=Ochrovirga pacifica TaxID=1042376 RepID=UPI0002558004|nr:rod shape-determining protein MreD [Ochrovirga pacifica]
MNDTLKLILRAILLLLTQVLIGNKMRIFGFVNPQWSLLFVLWFPIKVETTLFLITSFFFGLSLDFFSNSGGIHAAAFTFVAFLRMPVFKKILNKKEVFEKNFEYNLYRTSTKLVMIFVLSFLFHFVQFGLSYFDISTIGTVLWKAAVSSIFTTFVTLVVLSIFSPNPQ